MGLSGISPMSLLLILLIVVALFGTEKLKQLGTDLGKAIKNFQDAMKDDNQKQP
jgi:sec-independent protein translocase protein TatA